jgi:hypothetical protein
MKHYLTVVGLLALLPHALPAAEAVNLDAPSTPAAYKPLRFEEDYSNLADPGNRRDAFDNLRYIRLSESSPDWFLSLGGELRERFEAVDHDNFGIHGGADSFLLQRITLLADLHLGSNLRVFVSGISGSVWGEDQPALPVQDDPADLLFAFVEIAPYATPDERLAFRVGRYGLSLGSGRLVATRAAPNIPFRFDGFEILYSRPGWTATGFLNHPAKDSGGLDGSDQSITFWGLYVTHWLDAQRSKGVDLYYLGIHREQGRYFSGTSEEHRHSLGTRQFGQAESWDWNAEEVIQLGSFGSKDILAWTASLDGGYTFPFNFSPRLGLKADITSGTDKGSGTQETFDALFFKSGYFNDASLIRPQNIIDVHPNLTVNITRTLCVTGGAAAFWRYSTDDAVYAVPGFVAIPPVKSSSRYVGTAADLNLEWRVQRHVTLGASYVHFFVSNSTRQAGGKDLNYVSTTLSFLF